MKPRWDPNEFNTPQEMLVRAMFLISLAALAAGILLTLGGLAARELRLVVLGAVALGIGVLARTWLRRQGKWEQAEAAWQGLAEAAPPMDATHVSELIRLLREWETLEGRRGLPDFDPWALQAARHDIRALVEGDPALEGLFRERRRAA